MLMGLELSEISLKLKTNRWNNSLEVAIEEH